MQKYPNPSWHLRLVLLGCYFEAYDMTDMQHTAELRTVKLWLASQSGNFVGLQSNLRGGSGENLVCETSSSVHFGISTRENFMESSIQARKTHKQLKTAHTTMKRNAAEVRTSVSSLPIITPLVTKLL